jgi:hypothetical protein
MAVQATAIVKPDMHFLLKRNQAFCHNRYVIHSRKLAVFRSSGIQCAWFLKQLRFSSFPAKVLMQIP